MQKDAEDLPIKTQTMAKIFAQQGHYDEAIEIYRHLLGKDPGRRDLAEALARAQEKRRLETDAESGDVAVVLSEFIRVLLYYRQLLDLQALQRRLSSDIHPQ